MLVSVSVVITAFRRIISALGPCLSSQTSELLKPKVSLCLLPANSEKDLGVSFFLCLLLSCGTLQSQRLRKHQAAHAQNWGWCRVARGQTLEKRGAAGGTLSGAGPATVLRHGGSSARRPPRTPIPNLTAGACESAKASPERTGTGRGPALGAESGALPAGQPRPRPPRGATLHLQGGGGRDPLHEAHPYTGPLGGGRAPRPGNAAEAGEPRRSRVPCPREGRRCRAAGVRPSRLRDLRQRSVEVGGRAEAPWTVRGPRHLTLCRCADGKSGFRKSHTRHASPRRSVREQPAAHQRVCCHSYVSRTAAEGRARARGRAVRRARGGTQRRRPWRERGARSSRAARSSEALTLSHCISVLLLPMSPLGTRWPC